MTIPNKQSTRLNSNYSMTENTESIKNKSPNNLQILGTNTNVGDTFKSVEQKAWLYIGKIDNKCDREGIHEFLRGKLPGTEIIVEQVSKEESLSRSFKVGIDFKLLKEVNEPDFWPQGVTVRRFKFFRTREKLQQQNN